MGKPYLLTLSSHTKGMNRFLESLANLKNGYEHVAIQFGPYSDGIPTLRYLPQSYPGHYERYNFVPKNLDPSRYVLFCDTDDVIFQLPLPTQLDKDVYLASENILHEDTMWKNFIEEYPAFSSLMKKNVYNCGLYFVKVPILYKYIDFLNTTEVSDFRKYNFEQLHFNLFLSTHPEFSIFDDVSFLCPLYSNLDKGFVDKQEGKWKTKDGKIITAVHENGIKGRL